VEIQKGQYFLHRQHSFGILRMDMRVLFGSFLVAVCGWGLYDAFNASDVSAFTMPDHISTTMLESISRPDENFTLSPEKSTEPYHVAVMISAALPVFLPSSPRAEENPHQTVQLSIMQIRPRPRAPHTGPAATVGAPAVRPRSRP